MNDEKEHKKERLLIVGNSDTIHVGSHLLHAAHKMSLCVKLCDTKDAFDTSWPIKKLNWWLRGHRPPRLGQFSKRVVDICESFRPAWLLATGLAPLNANALEKIGELGIIRLNYLTDDPWNPAHQAPWFFEALPVYDYIFSPRRSNLADLQKSGCQKVFFLPFAYNPDIHFPQLPMTLKEQRQFNTDIVFVGGADQERLPYIRALIEADFELALYGTYWERYQETRAYNRGYADLPTLRKVIGGAKIALCLVRKANRDGHVMRTFEIPAMKGCMLTEDTDEHREILGKEGEAVVYFKTKDEMVQKTRWLLNHKEERERLAQAAHNLIVNGCNRYKDRLKTILKLA